jgi:branched-chain amino acid transport system substrate-binding protein
MYGMAIAYTMVDALRRAGRNPTRSSLMRAAGSLDERADPIVLPEIVVRTKPGDRLAAQQAMLQRWGERQLEGFRAAAEPVTGRRA